MVNSIPLDRCYSSILVKASPQKYISWDAGYFCPDNCDRPGHVSNTIPRLTCGEGSLSLCGRGGWLGHPPGMLHLPG